LANLDLTTWDEPDQSADPPIRWMATAGTIEVWRPQGGAATLHLLVASAGVPRQIAVLTDGILGTQATISAAATPIDIALNPSSGLTRVTLRTLDPGAGASGSAAPPRSLALLRCQLTTP
jgi:hypothetical protein